MDRVGMTCLVQINVWVLSGASCCTRRRPWRIFLGCSSLGVLERRAPSAWRWMEAHARAGLWFVWEGFVAVGRMAFCCLCAYVNGEPRSGSGGELGCPECVAVWWMSLNPSSSCGGNGGWGGWASGWLSSGWGDGVADPGRTPVIWVDLVADACLLLSSECWRNSKLVMVFS